MIETAADPRLKLGRHLRDKWRLDKLLGRGGMATVFAVTHRNGTRAAVKVLHPELCRDAQIKARLLREGYVANKVEHPGIVRVLDDDVTEDGIVYLVMELLEGETIKERWVKAGRELPALEVVDLAIAILEILAAAHDKGVIHRDIKPDNIFVVQGGGIKLLDFGIARLREGTADTTHTGAMLGTPAFMAPEQALAHWDRVDGRSDLFALGATMWTLVTGQLVHSATTIPELLVAAATKQAKPFASVAGDLPDEVTAAVDKALAFDQGERWSSASEMLEALRKARVALLARGTVKLDPGANPFHHAPGPATAVIPSSELPTPRRPATTVPTAARPEAPAAPRPQSGGTQALPVVPAPTVAVGPAEPLVRTRPIPATLSSGAIHVSPPQRHDSTPVRLQEAWPPRLQAPGPTILPASATTTVGRTSAGMKWAIGLAALAVAIALVVYITRTPPPRPAEREDDPSVAAAPKPAPSPPSTIDVVPVPDDSAAPATSTSASSRAAPSASSPPSATPGPAPPPPRTPVRPPTTAKPCAINQWPCN